MAMNQPKPIFTQFSWSNSRDRMFNECLREYYYHYYGSVIGWKTENPPDDCKKAAYLRHLTNLYLVFGEAFHEAAKETIIRYQAVRKIMTHQEFEEIIRGMLRTAVKDSMDKNKWMKYPKRSKMLKEIFENGVIPQKLSDEIKKRIVICVPNFFTSKSLKEVFNDIDVVSIKEKDELKGDLLINGITVWVKLDLLYQNEDKWTVVDWKTGKEADDRKQLLIYARYIEEIYKVPVKKLELRVENLMTGRCLVYQVTDKEIDEIEREIIKSQKGMQSLLLNIPQNIPKPIEAFPKCDPPKNCSFCNFHSICF